MKTWTAISTSEIRTSSTLPKTEVLCHQIVNLFKNQSIGCFHAQFLQNYAKDKIPPNLSRFFQGVTWIIWFCDDLLEKNYLWICCSEGDCVKTCIDKSYDLQGLQNYFNRYSEVMTMFFKIASKLILYDTEAFSILFNL